MTTMIADLRFAWRQALSKPLFTALVVGVLALGIGATTAIFSLTDAVLFRPLPIHEPERVVRIFRVDEAGIPNNNMNFPAIADLRDHATGFSHVAAYQDWAPFNLAVPGREAARISGAVVTGQYFELFGVQALLGRYLLPSDDEVRGGHPVVVLSEKVWRTQFGADPEIVGRTVTINTHPFTVVGVMPYRFGGADAQPNLDAWVPMVMMEHATPFEQWSFLTDRRVTWLDGIARLAPGVSLAAARVEVSAIVANVAEAEGLDLDNVRLGLIPATEAAIDPYGNQGTRRNGWLLLGVTLTLFLIAMSNSAGLLLVRTEDRARELALRLGLGAPRARVARMMLVEALTYAFAGAGLGVALAWLLLSVASAPLGGMLPGAPDDPALLLHWRVLAFAAALSVVTALAAVISPAARVFRLDVNATLKQGGARDGRSRASARSAFVVGQVVLSVGLLTVALLLVRSFWHTTVIDPGFDPQRALITSVDMIRQGYSPERAVQAQREIRERLLAHPAVAEAGFGRLVPVQSAGLRAGLIRPGVESDPVAVDFNVVSPGYLEAMRIPLLQGRTLIDSDDAAAPRAVVVNRTLAERWFAGEEPLGQHIQTLGNEWEIVGVVGDTKQRSLRETPLPVMYFGSAQVSRFASEPTLVIRGHGDDPWLLAGVARDAVSSVDRALPLFRARTLAEHVGRSYTEATVMAWLLGAFAALAVLLSAAGLYGLLSWQVRARTREIGIRMSIGATAAAVRNQILKRGFKLTVIGVPFGLLAAAWIARGLDELLFGVSATDPVTLFGVAAGFILVAMAATWAPAHRSARIDPMQALREE